MKLSPGEGIKIPRQINPLEEYLERGNYERLEDKHESYETICELIASTDPSSVIAVDGPSNGGKTTLTKTLIDFYREQGLPAVYIPLDYFLTDRNVRSGITKAIAEGHMRIDDYSRLAWEQGRFRATVLEAKAAASEAYSAQEIRIPNAYNRQTGAKTDLQTVVVEPGSVIITEGVGIQSYHDDLFDVTVRVDTYDDDALFERLRDREMQKPEGSPRLEEDFLRMRLETIDAPHTAYLRTNSPNADFVVDTSSFDEMLVYRHQ